MTQSEITERCSNAAGALIAQGPAEPGPISTRYVFELVTRAVRMGVDIGLDLADEAAVEQTINRGIA